MFDLTVFPLSVEAGRELYELPGLLVMAAPRKAARMRAQDHLVIYCQFKTTGIDGRSGVTLSPAQQQEILAKLAETYFSFAGSVTAGLRAVAARLNEFLLTRNLRAAQEGQTVGMLNMAVLHGQVLIVGHAGLTHTFILTRSAVEHFDDGPSPRSGTGAGRGLGLSRQAIPRFYQATLEPGDLMVMCDEPQPSWTARSLANSPQLNFDQLRRRLRGDSGSDLQAAVVRFMTGKGQVSFWRPGDSAVRPGESRSSGRGQHTVQRGAIAHPAQTAQSQPDDIRSTLNQSTAAPQSALPDNLTMGLANPVEGQPEISAVDFEAGSTPREPAAHPLDEPDGLSGTSPAPDRLASPRPRPIQPEGGQRSSPAVVDGPSTAETRPDALPTSVSGTGRLADRHRSRDRAGQARQSADASARPLRQPKPPAGPRGEGLRRALQPVWQSGRAAGIKISGVFSSAARKLPQRRNPQGQPVPFFNIPTSAMLAIALVIPLVMAAVASTVYFKAGRDEQYQLVFLQAQQAAQVATQQTDPVQQRLAWTKVLESVAKAEAYQRTDGSRALKKQATATLDNLDGYVRLDYQPAVSSGFGADVNITRIAATINDVYLLDTGVGRIFRLYRTASGYEVDAKFYCGGSTAQVGTTQVGPLIDMVPMPPNNPNRVSVMGIDAGGNLVLCKVAAEGFDSRPLALPDSGWGGITRITLNGGALFVLDPKGNAVYRYDANGDGDFADRPHLYFDNEIPKMADVIDLAVDQEFLYLLHADGSMTICESGGFAYANTKCTDPTPYGDSRTGFEPSPLSFAGTQFTQIKTTQPPDPSLYALDAKNKSIYHLSLRRLNLQRQYRPQLDTDFPFPNTAPTAFTIAPNRRALIAFGNQLFFAPIP